MTPACFCGRLPQSQTEWAQLLESQQKYHDSELQKWREIIKSSVMLLDQVRLHSSRQGGVQGVLPVLLPILQHLLLPAQPLRCGSSFTSISCCWWVPLAHQWGSAHQGQNPTGPKISHWHLWGLMSVTGTFGI